MTREQLKSNYKRYLASNNTELYQVYGSFSKYKAKALGSCKERVYQDNGMNGRIISHNSSTFTYGYEYEDTETGEILFKLITKDNTYILNNLGEIQ